MIENDFNEEKKKKEVVKEEEKINPLDITFFILVLIVAVCLFPYYKAIIDIFISSANAEVGRDIYYIMFAFIFSVAVMISGFTFRNGVIKILGLAFTTYFALYPMHGYFGNNSLFKKTLSDYDFVKLNIIRDYSCSSSSSFQQKLTNQLIEEYGADGFSIEVVTPTLDENATYKQKLKCMPAQTTMAYTLSYEDYYGEKREIIYINDNSFTDLVKVASFEIINDKIGEYLKEQQGKRNISYKMYLLQKKNNFIELDRKNLITESVLMEYPSTINLTNYNLDKRIVLEITMSDLSKRDEAHELIDNLADMSIYPLNIIINYGKSTEYFMQGRYYEIDSEREYIKLLAKRV